MCPRPVIRVRVRRQKQTPCQGLPATPGTARKTHHRLSLRAFGDVALLTPGFQTPGLQDTLQSLLLLEVTRFAVLCHSSPRKPAPRDPRVAERGRVLRTPLQEAVLGARTVLQKRTRSYRGSQRTLFLPQCEVPAKQNLNRGCTEGWFIGEGVERDGKGRTEGRAGECCGPQGAVLLGIPPLRGPRALRLTCRLSSVLAYSSTYDVLRQTDREAWCTAAGRAWGPRARGWRCFPSHQRLYMLTPRRQQARSLVS